MSTGEPFTLQKGMRIKDRFKGMSLSRTAGRCLITIDNRATSPQHTHTGRERTESKGQADDNH